MQLLLRPVHFNLSLTLGRLPGPRVTQPASTNSPCAITRRYTAGSIICARLPSAVFFARMGSIMPATSASSSSASHCRAPFGCASHILQNVTALVGCLVSNRPTLRRWEGNLPSRIIHATGEPSPLRTGCTSRVGMLNSNLPLVDDRMLVYVHVIRVNWTGPTVPANVNLECARPRRLGLHNRDRPKRRLRPTGTL